MPSCRLNLAVLLALLTWVPALPAADNPKQPDLPPPPAGAPRVLHVHPAEIKLDGPRSQQRLVILADYADGRSWDLSRDATFRTSSAKVAAVDADGVVRPIGDGKAEITVQAGGQTVRVPVTVRGATADTPVSFSREVVPLLTRAGCNQGACHGAALGRGGFRLSLRGFDPAFDYAEIVQSAKGRRVVVSDPERSILLMKPALLMEHAGGERFRARSRDYELLRQWLADGAPAPAASDADVKKLEVWPAHRLMRPGERQQLVVLATWSDGIVEDVTAAAQYDTLNESIARVTAAGLVTAQGKGEAHIMVRFHGQPALAQVSLPFAKLDAPLAFSGNYIDKHLAAKWQELGLTPSSLCSDEEFLRRLSLDAIGTLPTPDEIKAFLADTRPDKRTKAVDRILDRPEFVDYWALKWGDLLRINREQLTDKGMWSFHNYVRASLRDNKPADVMAREIITAEGSTFTDGPANFYLTAKAPPDWAETTAQVFLGVRMQCARCHHHPFEKWSQADYYGMTAFFSRVGTKNSQEFGLFGKETVVFLKPTGEVTHPRLGGVVRPHALDGPDVDDPLDRRVKLAEWITDRKNPWFARNLSNRFWAYAMGRGLVEPIDDLRVTNPPSMPDLLDALADDLTSHNYDIKHLLRSIFTSRAYQLASTSTAGNAADQANIYHTHYTRKRLTAEQLADALDFATGTQEKYAGMPQGTRAIQLPDTRVKSFLLDTFGRPARQITCECERTAQPNIAQALHLLNGDFLTKKIEAPGGRIDLLFKTKAPPEQIIDELYLVTLGRKPRPDELARDQAFLKASANPRDGAVDLLWVLLNSREFLFDH